MNTPVDFFGDAMYRMAQKVSTFRITVISNWQQKHDRSFIFHHIWQEKHQNIISWYSNILCDVCVT